MKSHRDVLVFCAVLGAAAAGSVPAQAHASDELLADPASRHAPLLALEEDAGCQACHENDHDGESWNADGWGAVAEGRLPAGPHGRQTLVVRPGQSIQDAIDRAADGARILILPGVYRETADPTNGLIINKSGISLIGLNRPTERVVLENAGSQRNGIVVVPSERSDCMGCHESMAPPFALKPGIDGAMTESEPALYDVEIRGITIRDFNNNGLFTERVDGFRIVDVHSDNNKNYGIFPTRSRNGLIALSKATGANDSGMWIETSERVLVTHNLVEDNTNGFETSNSDDIDLTYNVARDNSVGMSVLLLGCPLRPVAISTKRPGALRSVHPRVSAPRRLPAAPLNAPAPRAAPARGAASTA
ncbi:right-handed parallel beta-helix repeat-containing protein [Sorangium sp. So ce542]|uniref:right-handed parallel beta-helix repeat-containing protein n=1 Tax=Sorangium sp. So ce542 TaxID=3133316 RepID=UPI003F5DE063